MVWAHSSAFHTINFSYTGSAAPHPNLTSTSCNTHKKRDSTLKSTWDTLQKNGKLICVPMPTGNFQILSQRVKVNSYTQLQSQGSTAELKCICKQTNSCSTALLRISEKATASSLLLRELSGQGNNSQQRSLLSLPLPSNLMWQSCLLCAGGARILFMGTVL